MAARLQPQVVLTEYVHYCTTALLVCVMLAPDCSHSQLVHACFYRLAKAILQTHCIGAEAQRARRPATFAILAGPRGTPANQAVGGCRRHRISVVPGWAFLQLLRAESGDVLGAPVGLSAIASHPNSRSGSPTSRLCTIPTLKIVPGYASSS